MSPYEDRLSTRNRLDTALNGTTDVFEKGAQAQLVCCLGGSRQQVSRSLCVARAVAAEQHSGPVARCISRPRSGTHTRIHLKGILEVALGIGPLGRSSRCKAERAGHRAGRDVVMRAGVAKGVRKQVSIDALRDRYITQSLGDLGEESHAEEPLVRARQRDEVFFGQDLKDRARFGLTAEFGVEPCQHAAKHRPGRVVDDRRLE